MKPIKIISTVALTLFLLMLLMAQAHAAGSTPVGDLILLGTVERAGVKLSSDTSLFPGDVLRTHKASAGIIRIGRGRVEIDESSEVEIISGKPLRIILTSGTIAYNFPAGTAFEILTPQLEVRPNLSESNLSGRVTAQPQKEDRVESRAGNYTILEREPNGATNHIREGQTLVASLVPVIPVSLEMPPTPQGPLGGAQIAVIENFSGDVRVSRAATPNNAARVRAVGLGLANNDTVKTLIGGNADIRFTDQSLITLTPGTTIQIQQQQTPTGVARRISHFIGSMWFNIQRVTGTQTTLQTPTAVAAIRGTEGVQDVPNDFQSTHALNEGEQLITELVTQQSVTIRTGQRVTAIRGVGFTPVVALLALLAKPVVGGAGGGAGGAAGGGAAPGAAPGAAGGAAGGAATGAATSAATTATASTVSTVAASILPVAATVGVVTAVPLAQENKQTASSTAPFVFPGGQ